MQNFEVMYNRRKENNRPAHCNHRYEINIDIMLVDVFLI